MKINTKLAASIQFRAFVRNRRAEIKKDIQILNGEDLKLAELELYFEDNPIMDAPQKQQTWLAKVSEALQDTKPLTTAEIIDKLSLANPGIPFPVIRANVTSAISWGSRTGKVFRKIKVSGNRSTYELITQ